MNNNLRTMPYEQYLQTPEWALKREQTIERDGHRCRACNSNEKLQVHHRTYARRGCEDLNDLTTLCEGCHEHFHKKIRQDDIMARTYRAPSAPYVHNDYAWEEYLIGMLLLNDRLVSHICVIVSEDDFAGEATKALYQVLTSTRQRSIPFEQQSFEQSLDPDLLPMVFKCRNAADVEASTSEPEQIKTSVQVAVRMRKESLLKKSREINPLLEAAHRSGDSVEVRRLMEIKMDIAHKRRAFDIVSQVQG